MADFDSAIQNNAVAQADGASFVQQKTAESFEGLTEQRREDYQKQQDTNANNDKIQESVMPNKFGMSPVSAQPFAVQQGAVIPEHQYATGFSYPYYALKQSSMELDDMGKGLQMMLGGSPWSSEYQEQRESQEEALGAYQKSVPTWEKAIPAIATFVAQPEVVGATIAEQAGVRSLMLGAKALSKGDRNFMFPTANFMQVTPIGLGIRGGAAGLGWAQSDKFRANALNEPFDNSEYATASIMGMMGGASIGYLFHSEIGDGIVKAGNKAIDALKNGINPIVGMVSAKMGINKAKKAISDEITQAGMNMDKPVNGQDWTKLDEQQAQALSDHNEARSALGLANTSEPQTSIQMGIPNKLSAITDENVMEKLGISSKKFKGKSFESPIDAAIYRMSETDSDKVATKLRQSIKKLTGASEADIENHATLLKVISAGEEKGIATVFSESVDHVKPYIDESYNKRMALLDKTPYTNAYHRIESQIDDSVPEIQSLSEKKWANKLTSGERKRLTALEVRNNEAYSYRAGVEEKENAILDSLPSDLKNNAYKLNSSAIRHRVLRGHQQLAQEAMDGLDDTNYSLSPEDKRNILGLADDSTQQEQMKSHIDDNNKNESESYLTDNYNRLKTQKKKLDSEELAQETDDLDQKIAQAKEHEDWFKGLVSCLKNNEL